MRKFILLFFVATICSTTLAQSVRDEINKIKLDSSYVSAEATDIERNTALSVAINNLSTVLASKNIICDSVKLASAVSTKEVLRGRSIRLFVFIKRDDVKNLTVAIKPDTVSESIVRVPNVVSEQSKEFQLPLVMKDFMEATDIKSVYNDLSSKKTNGEVSDFGKCSAGHIPQSSYLLVFDQSFEIKAILSPEFNGIRRNMKTNISDDINNYSGCGAIWFTVNK
nr:hypothetical protein [Prevotella sp.]